MRPIEEYGQGSGNDLRPTGGPLQSVLLWPGLRSAHLAYDNYLKAEEILAKTPTI